ncbi:unnamed protein product [Rotaria sordida]|uniref:TauD/TfdA-like domain-containing protein n=1 Tax=Rotaria sordida TaxID=392033 RepID=A0A813Y216_9BILA|nr:unnamed protein product [Rotaria sordida]
MGHQKSKLSNEQQPIEKEFTALTFSQIQYICRHTNLIDNEVCRRHDQFLKISKDGRLMKEQFTSILQEIWPTGNVHNFSNYLFNLCDKGQKGFLEFTEFIILNCQLNNVKNVPIDDDNASYLSIAKAFGGEFHRDLRMPSRAMEADSVIYRVEEDPLNTNEYAYSATNAHFPLHTDCAHFLYPAQVMMLLCCQPSINDGDGKSILTNVDDVLKMLTEQQISDLATSQFPWWQGANQQVRAPILTKTAEGHWWIRFNQATLRREMGEDEFAKASALQSLIHVLNKIEVNPSHSISLASGDLLIVHNQRVLHGRTAFTSKSSRLLKRIRVRVPDL